MHKILYSFVSLKPFEVLNFVSLSLSYYNRKLLGRSGLVSFYAKRNQTAEKCWAPLYPREVFHVTLSIPIV
jgi:hypothetical protein